MLQLKFGNVANMPSSGVRRVFYKDSLESAPQELFSDPNFANVYEQAMMDVLAGPDPSGKKFVLVEVMDRINQCQQRRYEYRVSNLTA